MKVSEIRKYLRPFHYRVLIICACCLFLVSMLLPFLSVNYYGWMRISSQETYWSFKVNIKFLHYHGIIRSDKTYWFTTWWFDVDNSPVLSDLGVPWVSWGLMTMFLMQIFTLGSGFITLFVHRKRIGFLPLFFCLSVVILMTYVMIQFPKWRYPRIELGYWLCLSSAILFLFSFLLHTIMYEYAHVFFSKKRVGTLFIAGGVLVFFIWMSLATGGSIPRAFTIWPAWFIPGSIGVGWILLSDMPLTVSVRFLLTALGLSIPWLVMLYLPLSGFKILLAVIILAVCIISMKRKPIAYSGILFVTLGFIALIILSEEFLGFGPYESNYILWLLGVNCAMIVIGLILLLWAHKLEKRN